VECKRIAGGLANFDQTEGDKRLIRSKLEHLAAIAMTLPQGDKGAARTVIVDLKENKKGLDTDGQIAVINKQRDLLIQQSKPEMQRQLDALPPSDDEKIKHVKKEAQSAIDAGSVLAAQALIAQLNSLFNPQAQPTPNVQPKGADTGQGGDKATSIMDSLKRLRAAYGNASFRTPFDDIETATGEGRLDDASTSLRSVAREMFEMQSRFKTAREKTTNDGLLHAIDSAEKYYLAGRLEEARKQLTRIENLEAT
jgi:hypothetical protein